MLLFPTVDEDYQHFVAEGYNGSINDMHYQALGDIGYTGSYTVTRGLLTEVTEEGVTTYVKTKDFDYCWWAGSGQFMTAKGTYDEQGFELTPPTFAPGVVALLHIGTTGDAIDPGATENPEQWHRSQVAKYIRDNGIPGSFFGGAVTYYDVAGVRLMRPSDVNAWLSSEGLPGHEWAGGNSY